MRRFELYIGLLMAGMFASLAFGQGAQAPNMLKGKVTWVDDGDTVQLTTPDQKKVKIRFQGIDAPEVDHPKYSKDPAQPYSYESKDFVFRAASGRQVTVQLEPGQVTHGRLVGTVFLADGTNLDEALVKAGLAWWYVEFTPNHTNLARAEAEARYAKLGLWKDADPTPPWVFRHPDRASDWEKTKCDLHTKECPAGNSPATCSVEVDSKDVPTITGVTFTSSGVNECVAHALLEYQLCRSERESDVGRIVCE